MKASQGMMAFNWTLTGGYSLCGKKKDGKNILNFESLWGERWRRPKSLKQEGGRQGCKAYSPWWWQWTQAINHVCLTTGLGNNFSCFAHIIFYSLWKKNLHLFYLQHWWRTYFVFLNDLLKSNFSSVLTSFRTHLTIFFHEYTIRSKNYKVTTIVIFQESM